MSAILDTRRALLDLLNVSFATVELNEDDPEIYQRAERFLATYGPLRDADRIDNMKDSETLKQIIGRSRLHAVFFGPPYTPPQTVTNWAWMLGWAVSHTQEAKTRAALNMTLSSIFNGPVTIDGTVHPTALDVDIVGGTIEPRPRDLLDAIALELMRSRKVIARCALCSKFFYRTFSKDKYCSTVCGSEARRKAQLEWVRTKRAEDNKKKSRKTRRKA